MISGWWARQDLNLRATGYEPVALPLSYGPAARFYQPPQPRPHIPGEVDNAPPTTRPLLLTGAPRARRMNTVQFNSPEGAAVAQAPILDRSQRAEIAKAARHEEILDAARSVFAARGFKGTTIADIAEGAGIALGTVYLYFPSKDAVFEALSQRFAQIITNTLTAPVNSDLRGNVASRIDNVFEACRVNRDLVRLVVLNTDSDSAAEKRRRAAEEHRYQPMVNALTYAIAEGWVRDADPVIMTKLIIGLVSIAVYQAYVISDGDDADKLRAECAAMILAYMRPAETGTNQGLAE